MISLAGIISSYFDNLKKNSVEPNKIIMNNHLYVILKISDPQNFF
jgi:hypothetical protein